MLAINASTENINHLLWVEPIFPRKVIIPLFTFQFNFEVENQNLGNAIYIERDNDCNENFECKFSENFYNIFLLKINLLFFSAVGGK